MLLTQREERSHYPALTQPEGFSHITMKKGTINCEDLEEILREDGGRPGMTIKWFISKGTKLV